MRILIIEDELNSTDRLEKLIDEFAPEKKIVGKSASIYQTIQGLNENEIPDLIFSDAQFSGGLSFDIFNHLKKKVPVIFINAYNYVVEGFKAEDTYYFVKPIEKEELRDAILQYDSNYKNNKQSQADENKTVSSAFEKYQERFIVHVGTQMKLVQDTDIAYLYIESKTVFLVTFSKQKYIVDIPLETFEKMLNPKIFYRINRQFIVQLKAIAKMAAATKQRIALTLEPETSHKTITSFDRTPQFKKWLLGNV
jgi:DNA-binding LytR/AlgR family response regulator